MPSRYLSFGKLRPEYYYMQTIYVMWKKSQQNFRSLNVDELVKSRRRMAP